MTETTAAVCEATAEGLNVWLIPMTDALLGGRLLWVVMARSLEGRGYALDVPADADDNTIATAVRHLRRLHAAQAEAPSINRRFTGSVNPPRAPSKRPNGEAGPNGGRGGDRGA